MNLASETGYSEPSAEFARSVAANLAYWRTRTESQEASNLATLDAERQNLYRAVQYGLMLPDVWPAVAEVAIQSTSFMSRCMFLPEWISVLERLLAAAPEDDLERRFQLLIKLGKVYRINLQLEAADRTFQQAETIAKESGNKNAMAEADYQRGFNFLRMRRYAEAERYARQVLEILSGFKGARPWLIAEAHRTLGEIAGKRGELDEAEAYLRESVALWREIGRRSELARNIDALANVLRYAGKFEEAIASYEEATRLLAPTNNGLDKSLVQINLGVLHYSMGDLEAAEQAFRRADSNWLRRSGNRNYRAIATFNLGNVLLAQERWEEAEPLLRRAIGLQKQMEDEVTLANATGTLGECLAGQGEKAAAEAQFDEAIGLLEKHPDDAKARRLLKFFRGERAKLLNERKEEDTPQD